MRFLVDAQLPPGLVFWLKDQGYDADHVDYCGLVGAKDPAIWDRAIETGAILITKDEDFSSRMVRSSVFPTVVWLRIGNATNRVLIAWLSSRWETTVELLQDGHKLVEVR
jgi:predicted nuclease of predicted toxin-antitoxin system